MRKVAGWNHWVGNFRNSRKSSQASKRRTPLRTTRLGMEHLERREVLSANPVLTVVPSQFVSEGSPLSITNVGSFSDVVEGQVSGAAIGLKPENYASLGAFDPLTNVVINTDTLVVSGGFSAIGTLESANVGFGSFQIAVFAFSSFELDAGRTITATGSRPLAILSQSNMTIAGTIDGSAVTDGTINNGERIAGPGGGNGGLGSTVNVTHPGTAAAGAPANSAGQALNGGGTGGGF